jgi:hypothetical protein
MSENVFVVVAILAAVTGLALAQAPESGRYVPASAAMRSDGAWLVDTQAGSLCWAPKNEYQAYKNLRRDGVQERPVCGQEVVR